MMEPRIAIRKFVELVIDGYDTENKNTIVEKCESLVHNPEAYITENEMEWLREFEPEEWNNIAVPLELYDILITGDKIDEIHSGIEATGVSIPDFPYDKKITPKEYFAWVAPYLQQEDLELLMLGNSLSDEFYLIMVLTGNADEILRLSEELSITCKRPVDYLF
ncbi:MAG: hypothetical protein QM727_02865 [Niabella sp.]